MLDTPAAKNTRLSACDQQSDQAYVVDKGEMGLVSREVDLLVCLPLAWRPLSVSD